MAVPKKRTSHSATRQRRNHQALKAVSLHACSSCGELILPHRVCKFCGNYRDKKVITIRQKSAEQ